MKKLVLRSVTLIAIGVSIPAWAADMAVKAPPPAAAAPYINYNMAHGWFLTSSPAITANWLAAPGQQ